MKTLRVTILIGGIAVVAGCAEPPPPRSVQEFLDNPIVLADSGEEIRLWIEERLDASPFLMGDQMSVADVTAAPQVFYGIVPDEVVAKADVLTLHTPLTEQTRNLILPDFKIEFG